MKILVTGVKGQLGYDICRELASRGYTDVLGIDREELDITDKKAVQKFIGDYRPDVIMHNAAWTAVDKAEDMADECYKVNVLGTRYISQMAKKIGAKLVYISTDYVFGGDGDQFYEVDSPKAPLSVYGKTKYEGELEAEKCKKHFIVRISWVFGINGSNFVKTMLRLAETKTELNVVSDQIGSPTYTFDLAKLLCDMIETEKYGTYHATNEGICSWCDFAREIFKVAGIKTIKVNAIPTSEYPTRATRPLNSRLSKTSLDEAGFSRLPDWHDALQRYIKGEIQGETSKKKRDRVLVIMSSYNGEQFLREQIDSILAQKDVDLDLFVTDDCSTDGSAKILEEYAKVHKNFSYQVNETNKNFTYNFIDALFKFKDNTEYDYYAFSDQDDFWLDDKLSHAISKIKGVGECTLYSSNLKVVDSELKYLGVNMKPYSYNFRHYDIICSNIVTGCTIVMDRAFKDLATSVYPENIYLHDYYLALIATYVQGAHFYYDIDPKHILYRQHGSNQIGSMEQSFAQYAKKELPQHKTTSNLISVFYKNFGGRVSEKDAKIFQAIVDSKRLKNRIYLMFKVKSNYAMKLRAKLFLNKY